LTRFVLFLAVRFSLLCLVFKDLFDLPGVFDRNLSISL